MKPLIRSVLCTTLIGSLFGCANFIDRLNGSVEQEEHIIIVLPRAPLQTLPQTQPQGAGAPPLVTYRAPTVSATPQVSGIFTANTPSGVRVAPRPITVDSPYRQKEMIAEAPAPAPAPTSAPKVLTPPPESTPPSPLPVVEMKPVAPTPPPAPLEAPPPAPIAAIPVAPPPALAPAAPLNKTAAKNETPNPDSMGGLIARRAVYYNFDTANLSDEYKAIVLAHAKYLAQNPKAKVKLRGNCDERGSREYNISLGSNRAESVKELMIANGASAKQVETESFGKEKPMATGHDEQSWAKNRRVDILYSEDE